MLGEGWEYSTVSKENFHPLPKTFDTIRRRKWIRRLITKSTFGPTAMFNLETTLAVRFFYYFIYTCIRLFFYLQNNINYSNLLSVMLKYCFLIKEFFASIGLAKKRSKERL